MKTVRHQPTYVVFTAATLFAAGDAIDELVMCTGRGASIRTIIDTWAPKIAYDTYAEFMLTGTQLNSTRFLQLVMCTGYTSIGNVSGGSQIRVTLVDDARVWRRSEKAPRMRFVYLLATKSQLIVDMIKDVVALCSTQDVVRSSIDPVGVGRCVEKLEQLTEKLQGDPRRLKLKIQ